MNEETGIYDKKNETKKKGRSCVNNSWDTKPYKRDNKG